MNTTALAYALIPAAVAVALVPVYFRLVPLWLELTADHPGRHVIPRPVPPRRRRILRWLGRRWGSWRRGALTAPALLVRAREAIYQFRWAHSAPVRPEHLPRAEAALAALPPYEPPLPPLPDEDDLTLQWLSDVAHPARRVRAAATALAALTTRLTGSAPAVPDETPGSGPAAGAEPEPLFGDWRTGQFRAVIDAMDPHTGGYTLAEGSAR